MKIAVTYDNGQVFGHFGRTQRFAIFEVEDGRIVSSAIRGTDGRGHGALAGVLTAEGVDALICGGIGMGARMALEEAGIALYPGAQGSCEEAVKALLAGNLSFDPDAECDHHGHEHGEGCEDGCGEDCECK